MTATTAAAPSPAVAPPPGNPRFALFDSLRGIAAVAIILFHVASLTGALDWAVVGDAIGVAGPRSLVVFFVISGFLLYRPYVASHATGRPAPRTSRYLRRRVLRIVPAYWLALTALAIFPGIAGVFSGDWWRYYFFLQLYSEETVGRGIPVAWSLCVEVTYYLLLPLWAIALGRLGGAVGWLRAELSVLAVAAGVGIGFQIAGSRNVVSDIVASTLLGQLGWLALGMALAVASVAAEQGEREPRAVRFVVHHPGLCWLGAGAAFAALAALIQPGGVFEIIAALSAEQPLPETLAAIALTFAFSALLVLPAVFGESAGGLPRRILASRPVAWLGLVSYGLFLWHLPVALFLARSDDAHFSAEGLGLIDDVAFAATPILFAMTLAVTAVLAAFSYYVVELPFLKRK